MIRNRSWATLIAWEYEVCRVKRGYDKYEILAYTVPMDSLKNEIAKLQALGMAILCVRNTCIEDIHEGTEPRSQTGDFSDVRVVTPYGEIPWNEVSRITNDEMRSFMKQVVDRLYTFSLRADDVEFVKRMMQFTQKTTYSWDAPTNLTDWFTSKWDSIPKSHK